MASGIRSCAAAIAGLLLLGCAACSSREQALEAVSLRAAAEFAHGELKHALDDVDTALAQHAGPETAAFWRLRLMKAEILIWQGDIHSAVSLLATDAPLPRELAARRHVLLGIAYNNLQKLTEAEHEFAEAARLNSPEISEVTGELLLGWGRLAAIRHDARRSEQFFRQAAEVSRRQHMPLLQASALGNLGMLQMQQHQYAEAADWFNASLNLAEPLKAEANVTRTLGNLGWAYLKMGDLDRAEDFFSQAVKDAERLGIPSSQETWLSSLAGVYLLRRDYRAAAPMYEHALALARRLDDRTVVASCLTDLARIANERGDFSRAEQYNHEALGIERALGSREDELYSLSVEAEIAIGKGDHSTGERWIREVVDNSGGNPSLRAAALSTWGKLDATLGREKDADQHYRAAIEALDQGRKQLGREEYELSYPTTARDTYDDYVDLLLDHKRDDDAFAVVEAHRARTLIDGLKLDSQVKVGGFSLARARRIAARANRVILSYWLGKTRSYLFVITPKSTQTLTLPGSDQIRPLVDRYRAHMLSSFEPYGVQDAAGQALYQMLVAPALPYIPPSADVTVVPDGALCLVNFETLVAKDPKPHYWIEDVSITEANSILLLESQRSAPRASPAKDLLLVGDPVSPVNYATLLHAHDEIEMVRSRFSENEETVLAGKSATPSAYLKSDPGDYALIHFVAHGTASRLSPLDSAIVLSKDGQSHNLYAREIARHPLHARLVTISACDSAGTRVYSADGLVGLSWAFLRAGARQVISALWEVNDASTPRLMSGMYASITQGDAPAAALRKSKLAMLHSQSVYRNAYYWGSFVLYEGY